MATELDGAWNVRRTSGALPPMWGVRKRIDRGRGETIFAGGIRLGFSVRGLELHYDAPLRGFVDVVEPAGEGFRGRATVLGRTIGRFELERR